MVKSSSIWYFHFLDVFEKGHSEMRAEGPDFLAVVERSKVWFSEDIKPFADTEFASFCHWIVRLPSVQDFPLDIHC